MAVMYPEFLRREIEISPAERKLYNILKQNLDENFTVIWNLAYQIVDTSEGIKDGEIDFFIIHPEHGYLIVEVKGGRVYYVGKEKKWYSEDKKGNVHEIKDPFDQVRKNFYNFREWLKQSRVIRSCDFRKGGYVVAFPDAVAENINIFGIKRETFWDFYDLLEIKKAIKRTISFSFNLEGPGAKCVKLLVDLLAPTWKFRSPLKEETLHKQETFTEQQFALLDVLQRQRKALIAGCAGSGKTFLAAEKAKRLAQSGFKVLFLCFNRNLAEWLKPRLIKHGVHVDNFHSFCFKYLRRAGVEIKVLKQIEGGSNFWKLQIPDLLLKVLEKERRSFSLESFDDTTYPLPFYDAIIVDEGQDFEPFWWIPLEQLLKDPERGILYIFYDDNQKIFVENMEFPIESPPYVLTKNCRNTKPIHDQFVKYYKGDHKLDVLITEGPSPKIIRTDNPVDTLRRTVFNLIDSEKFEPKDIVVLTPYKEAHSSLKEEMKLGNYRLSWHNVWDTERADSIRVSTIHAFKGLEAPVVIVMEIENIRQFERWEELLYVAFSRARYELIILTRELSSELSPYNVFGDFTP